MVLGTPSAGRFKFSQREGTLAHSQVSHVRPIGRTVTCAGWFGTAPDHTYCSTEMIIVPHPLAEGSDLFNPEYGHPGGSRHVGGYWL